MSTKRSNNFWKRTLFLILLLSIFVVVKSQVDNFQISVQNITQTSANKLEFDVYLLDADPGQTFELASCQLGFLINSLITSGSLSFTYDNTGSGLNLSQQFNSTPSVVTPLTGYPNQTLLRLAGRGVPGAGNGTIISTSGFGTLLTHIIITSTTNFTTSSTPDLTFTANTATSPLYPTRVNEYISTVNTPLAVTPGVNAIVNGNPILNPPVTPPNPFNVTGGGAYCQGSGGLPVGVAGSETGVTYTLYKNTISTGITVSGTGSAITFGNQLSGNYTVKGTNAGGTTDMNGSAVITENPLPAISGNLSVCIGATTQLTGSGTPAVSNPWVSGTPSVATVTSTGLVTGISGGSTIITYTNSNGCSITATVTVNTLPTITGTLNVCVGSTTQLTGSGTPAVTNPWVSGSTGIATVNSTGLVSGISAGNSNITYTNSTGCQRTVTITVNALPVVTFPGTLTAQCVSSTTYALSGGSPVGGTYSGPGVSGTNFNASVAGVGNHTITYTYTNASGCTNTATNSITVNELPSVTLTSSDIDNIFCHGTSVTFIAGGGVNYNFRVGGVTVQNGASNTYVTSALINGQKVSVTVTSSAGCIATSAEIINFVNPLPFMVVTTPPTCASNLLTYYLGVTVSSGTVTSTAGTVTNMGGNVWSITGVPAGTNITVRVSDINACESTIAVTAPNCDCAVILAPVSGGDKSYCESGTIPAINVTVLAGQTADWYGAPSGGSLLRSNSLTFTPVVAGTYYAEARKLVDNCVSSTRTPVTIVMNPLPVPLLSSSDADNKFCIGSTITFTAQGGITYEFRVNASTKQTGASSVYTTSSLANNDIVDVIVTNSNNCTATSGPITNTVYALPTVSFGGTLAAQCLSSTTYALTGGLPAGGIYSGPGVTGTNFNANSAGVGTHTITYTYTNANGCPGSATNTITVNALPTVTFSGTLTAQCVSSITYALTGGSPAGGIYSGNGVTGTNFNASVAGVGTHTITYSYTNANGCTNSASKTITVNALPVVTFTGTLTAQCVNSTTYALSGGSPVDGTYSGPGVTGTNFNASLAGVGTHTITYSYTNASGCTRSATNTITVNALPAVTFSGTLTAQCVSSTTYTLTGGSPSGGTYSGPGVTGTNFNASIAGAGTHTITYSFTNANGCSGSATKTITVNALPTVTFGGTLTAQCVNSITYTLTGGLPAGGTYSGAGVSGTNFNASVAGVGTKNLTYSYTNANGCTNTATNTITVNALPTPTLTSSDADNTICAGTSVTFTAGGGTNYNFRVGGTSVQNGTGNTYTTTTLANNNIVSVIVTNSNGCTATSAGITNTVYQVPAGNAGTGGNECDLDFVLNAVPSIGTGTWSYTTSSPGSATFTPNANTANATVSVTGPGIYFFTWTEINNICSKSSTITVNFYQQPVADAGKGGNNCGPSRTLNAVPSVGTGTWTKTSGPGNVTFSPNANNPKATATVSAYGLYNLTWKEVNGTCSSSDTINVNFLQVPTPNAGTDGSECDLDFVMKAIQGSGAGAGLWSLVSGPGTALFTPSASLPGATVTVSAYGTYVFAWTEINGTCFASDQVTVIFRALPSINAGRDTVKCLGTNLKLQAAGTGTFRWTPAVLVSNPNISNPDAINIDPVNYVVTLTDQYGCKNSDTVFVDVWDTPFAFAGADTTLEYIFTLKMNADNLYPNETGLWSLVSGSAQFDNPGDPKTRVTELGAGENIILWTVKNGICPDFNDYVAITVNNLVVPTLITPNGDQNNEYFVLRGIETLGRSELIIFDRRGAQVWQSDNYENDWNGLDHNGKPLPEDTYYYTLRAQNGVSMSGYVVIRR